MPLTLTWGTVSTGASISGVTEGTPTTTGVAISWNVTPGAQGQIEYDTNSGAPYASSSTLETSLLTFHSQTLSALTPGTVYYYRIRAVDASSVVSYSSEGSFTTASAASRPTITALTTAADNSDTLPAYLVASPDATWETEMMRLASTSGRETPYPKNSAWSKDATYVYLHGGRRILDGSTYADLGSVGTAAKADYPVWSNVTDTRMYGADDGQSTGTGRLWVCNVTGPTWSILTDFTGGAVSGQTRAYGYVEIGNYEGSISNDDHLIALACNTSSSKSGQWDVIAYDPIDNVVRGTLTNLGGQPSECGVSQSGSYVYVNGIADGSGTFQGCRLYTSAMASVRQIVTYRPHLDMGYEDEAGTVEALINAQAGTSHRLSDGTTTDLFPGANPAIMGGHVSCRNLDYPGWSVWSDSQSANSAKRGYRQIVALKNDGSEDVMIFGNHHEVADIADNGNYAVPNRDLSLVMVTTRWGGSTAYPVLFGMEV